MKKFAYILLSTAAVSLFAGCSKELNYEPVVNPGEPIELTVNAGFTAYESVDTRTEINGSSITWSTSGEKIKVYEVATDGGATSVASATSNVGTSTDSYVTMSFNVSLTKKTADNFTYYGSYPSSAGVSNSSTTPQANLETKSAQSPTATSFDPSADLLISKGIDNGTSQPKSLSMQFARPVAIAKMTLTNLPVAETVNKVTFSANNGSDVVLAGRTTFNLSTVEPVTGYGDVIAKKEIEISTAALGLSASTSMDVWFTCYPFELATGNTFTVVVETDTYSCSRTVTIPAARELNFIAGKASRFSVDMTTATVTKAQLWSKYTGDFSAGEYLIVYNGQAMKAGISSDRFTYTGVTAVNDEIFTNNTDIIWEAAASSTYWTLYNAVADKYAASTGADNKAQILDDGSDDKSLWTVSGDGAYEFVNKYNAANSKNSNLRYNSGYGFACYGTGIGGALTLYKKDTRTQLSAPATVSASLNGSDNTVIDVTFSSVANAGTYTIVATPSVGDAIVKAGVASSPATISVADGLAYATTYTISVYAVPSDAATYRKSDATAAAGTVTTGAVPPAAYGTTLWLEPFTGFSNSEVPTSSNASTTVYGGGLVTYACTVSGTQVYASDNTAGGETAGEILIKDTGTLTVSGIPTGQATAMTLSFKSNNGCVPSISTPSATIGSNLGSDKTYVYSVTVPANTETITLVFTNSAGKNTRVDDLRLVVGAPVPGITVTTDEASDTRSLAGTTATLNGTLALINGAVNSSVTSAGFYYKVSGSGGDYTKVTCASAPTSTTNFSYNLTGLTTDIEYTYYAWAVYDSGSEVTGTATEQTFTPIVSNPSYSVTYTVTSKTEVSTSGTAPAGSSASYSQTDSKNGNGQMTSGNSITLTLSGFDGKKITGASISAKSNTSKGGGSLSLTSDGNTIASIADSKFNSANWNGAWSTSYVNVGLSVTETTIGTSKTIVLNISATENSLYFESLTLTYE